VRVETQRAADGRARFVPVPGSAFELEVDLVLLAMGFTGAARGRLLTDLGVAFTASGAVATDDAHRTSVDGVFAAGDVRRGASLIVWAIREGRDAAERIDEYLRRRSIAEARAAARRAHAEVE
jgi:glutamate synthase (NADPH/NADH) small chain